MVERFSQKDLQDQMSTMLPSSDTEVRPEDFARNREDNFTAASFAEDSWQTAKERFMDAGKIDVDPDDPALFTAYKRSVDYLKDVGLSGLELADAAFKYAVGTVSQVMPTEQQEKRMARDLYSMPDAFMGAAGAKSLTQLDDAVDLGVETAKQYARNMPEYDPTVARVFAGPMASNPPNMTGYGSIDSTFNAEADWQTLQDLSIDFENDPSGSMNRMMDEVENNPSKYPSTLQELQIGQWFRGRDNLMRFEIDDSASKATPDFATVHTRDELNDMFSGHDYEDDGFMSPYDPFYPDSQEKMYSTLSDVFSHRELFEKYPELSDMPVVVDQTMDADTLGYYDPSKGLIALSPDIAKDADATRSTLLHEIQHAVQRIEGFETGTGASNADVIQISMAGKNSPTIKNLEANYEKELDNYLNSSIEIKKDFISKGGKKLAESIKEFELRLIAEKSSTISKNNSAISFKNLKKRYNSSGNIKQLVKDLRAKDLPSEDKIFTVYSTELTAAEALAAGKAPYGFTLLPNEASDYKSVVVDGGISYLDNIDGSVDIKRSNEYADNYVKQLETVLARVADRAVEEGKTDLFKKVFKLDPKNVVDNFFNGSPEFFIEKTSGLQIPYKPDEPVITPLKLGGYDTNKVIYRAKRGEAEARNVQRRMDMSASERTPENVYSTEDVVPEEQWGDPELKRAKAGEDIFAEGKVFGLKGEPEIKLDPEPDPKQSFIESLRKKFGFAEGGAVGDMRKQMSLFEQGGITDGGVEVDPVSGNEVPPGSLPEEVRDDIPAMLSEGEYVVPADVLRYYGVKFFEDLRNNAKMGLTEMEADGRIGGEPVMDQEITEDDLAALDQMLTTGAAEGGLMDKLEYVAKNDPQVNQRLNQGGMVVGFAEGGMTQSLYSDPNQIDQVINKVMTAARQNPKVMEQLASRGIQINRTEPQMQPQEMDQANPMSETRKAFFQGGVTGLPMAPQQPMGITPNMSEEDMYRYITSPTTIDPMYNVPGGSYIGAGVETPTNPTASTEYCASLGMAYDAEKQMCVPKEIETPKPSSRDDDDTPIVPTESDSNKDWFTDEGGVSELNFSDPESIEAWAEGLSKPMQGEKLLKGAAKLIGGPLGLVGAAAPQADALADISSLRAASIIAKARGDTSLAETLDGFVDERLKSSGKLSNMLEGVIATGNKKAERYAQYLGFEDLEDMSKEENKEKLKARTRQYTVEDLKQDKETAEAIKKMSAAEAEKAGISTAGGSKKKDKSGKSPIEKHWETFKPATTGTATVTDSDGKKRTVATYDPDKVKEISKTTHTPGRARGGLMTKRK